MAFIRSVSLTRNSPAPLIMVVPLACVAIRARMGISSIREGIILPEIVTPLNEENLTLTLPMGSLPWIQDAGCRIHDTADPIFFNTVSNPIRYGLRPTFLMIISEPGTNNPAAMKYAADEKS